MLRQRIVTAVVLLLALAAALWSGPAAFSGAMSFLIGAAAFEWLRLAQHSMMVAVCGAVLLAVGLFGVETLALVPVDAVSRVAAVALGIWIALAIVLVQAERAAVRVVPAVSTLLCLLLLAAAYFAAMLLLRQSVTVLLSALAIVWVADTAAYFAGKRWGRTKLAPRISPGKTWAGVGGAMIGVLGLSYLFCLFAPQWPLFGTSLLQRLPLALGFLALALLVALSIVGDLFESLLKRQAGAKDSGRLLPGHGGVLDRIDALLPALPAAALLLVHLLR